MMKDGVESYHKVNDGREESAPAVSADTETDVKERSEEVGEDELLPGIPNDITVQVICPKLSFKDLAILCLVNKKWGQTVHDARARSSSTETLIILHKNKYSDPIEKCRIALHSPRDLQPCFFLPPMPVRLGFRYYSKCIGLAGKIYILGGRLGPWSDSTYCFIPSNEVYVFDLVGAGLPQWKQCASMQTKRSHFGAGALDGKIYVFGTGYTGDGVQSEVYDPETDTWSPIPDMMSSRYKDYQVATLGEELILYGGTHFFNSATADLVAYHPGKNKWRYIEISCYHDDWKNAFVAQGKFHRICPGGIDVYDMDKNSWSFRHSIRGLEAMKWREELRHYTIAVGDTIWILADGFYEPAFAKIEGFGSNQREVDPYIQTVISPGNDHLTIQL